MRIFLICAAALLVSGTRAQHGDATVIDNETDLLALPTDQLIDSDVELIAVESVLPVSQGGGGRGGGGGGGGGGSLVFNNDYHALPFGARLPGLADLQFAYGYEIVDSHSKGFHYQGGAIPSPYYPEVVPPKRSSPLKESPGLPKRSRLSLKDSPPKESPSASQVSPVHPKGSTHVPPKESPSSTRPLSVQLRTPEETLQPPIYEYLPPDVDSRRSLPLPSSSLDTIYLPPPTLRTLQPESPPPPAEYLPPVQDFRTEPAIPPETTTTTTTTTTPPPTTISFTSPPLPRSDYLPPVQDFRTEPSIPPESTTITTTLPSSTASFNSPPLPLSDYLPPVQDFRTEPSIPPKTTTTTTTLPSSTASFTSPPLPLSDYLPPVQDFRTEPSIPPKTTTTTTTLPSSTASFTSPPLPLSDYLPPVQDFGTEPPIPPETSTTFITTTTTTTTIPPPTTSTSTPLPPSDYLLPVLESRTEPPVPPPPTEPPGILPPLQEGYLPPPEDMPSEGIIPATERAEDPAIAVFKEAMSEKILPKVPKKGHFSSPSSSFRLPPLAIYNPIPENAIVASVSATSPPLRQVEVAKAHTARCRTNTDCAESEICLEEDCVDGCSIITQLCVGYSRCETRRHTPGCFCPAMFPVIELDGRYDCMPMLMAPPVGHESFQIPSSRGLHSVDLDVAADRSETYLRQIRPVGAFHSQSRIATGSSPLRQSTFSSSFDTFDTYDSFDRGSVDPCSSDPCGPNTRCERVGKVARCRCLADFVPDDNTIRGCKPQCTVASECPDDMNCRNSKCVRACERGACGIDADCVGRNHQARCSCPAGYEGDPNSRCRRIIPPAIREPEPLPYDPCFPNPCGTEADCRSSGQQPVCSCPVGYSGDPLTRCIRGECITNDDCPTTRSCQQLSCVDPCIGQCGEGAICRAKNHNPVCSCGRGFTGDPFIRCREMRPEDFCNPSPCGTGAICKPGRTRATCACPERYIGNPLEACRPECITDTDCNSDQVCRNDRCINPCVNGCGTGAICDARNHRAICRCPDLYQGDPHTKCYAECTEHDACNSRQACLDLRCEDPCTTPESPCGRGADCKVENHKPICSCPKGFTGHPFESCRPFTREDLCNPNPCGDGARCTPGYDSKGEDRPVCVCQEGYIGNPLSSCRKGSCTDHSDCAGSESCYQYQCQNACYVNGRSVCGADARCIAKDHTPVCSCARGYIGNPLESCRPGPGATHGGFSRYRY